MQAVAPITREKEPAGQRRHDDTLLACITGLYVPALQFVGRVLPLPGPQNEPAGHSVQLAWSTTGLKEPGAQGEHKDEPMMEWDPAGHTVTMSTVLKT